MGTYGSVLRRDPGSGIRDPGSGARGSGLGWGQQAAENAGLNVKSQMADGKTKAFTIYDLPFAIQDAFVSILLETRPYSAPMQKLEGAT